MVQKEVIGCLTISEKINILSICSLVLSCRRYSRSPTSDIYNKYDDSEIQEIKLLYVVPVSNTRLTKYIILQAQGKRRPHDNCVLHALWHDSQSSVPPGTVQRYEHPQH